MDRSHCKEYRRSSTVCNRLTQEVGYIKVILVSIVGQFYKVADIPKIYLKDIELNTSFLVNLAMAYPLISPFLKGFYLTMNSCIEGRDKNGWKMSNQAYDYFMKYS